MYEFRDRFDWRQVIRDHRRRKKLSQPELGRRSGLSLSVVKPYESGSRHPDRETLVAIIDALVAGSKTGELMRFAGRIHVGDIWQAFAWHDWIPEDAETMGLLES